ncbi:MAG: Asp-tRNA(Asn)/Glu-tRNA(Gln) amidotransferase subunit GatA [Minisyncoccia bacterium]
MIKEFHQKLINGEITATQLVENYFNNIEKKDKQINAYLTLNKEMAFRQAQEIDKKIKKKEKIDVLTGIPYAVKDNILTKGIRTTAGSKILDNYFGAYEATVIEKLNQRGAILLGKTNLDEFAMGSSTENSAFFVTKNPNDLERVPGGSSGGSAAAVKSEMAVFALGSDTGGSVRQPAAFCGVVGFKPTYGAVSRYGLIAMASSLDVIGPLTLSVEDAEIVFEAIYGKDENDATSFELKKEKFLKPEKETIIGVPKEFFIEGLDKEVKEIMKKSITKLENNGFKIEEISLPLSPYALACYYIIMPAEVSANLARYDGIRYAPNPKFQILGPKMSLKDLYFQTRGEGFGKEVRRRIVLGTYVLSRGYYEAFYKKAQKVRKLIVEEWENAFQKVDFILTPTSPTPAFKIGEKTSDPLSMYLSDIFTVSANICGLPAISLNAGYTFNKLPTGIQFLSKRGSDFQLLDFCKKIENILI